ncbi:hypothetical protein [Ekhidna sp.]
MKKLISLLTLLLIGTVALSQNFEAPKTGAKVYTDNYTINLDVNGEETFDLWIVRSKRARRAKFMTPTVLNSNGIKFQVTPDPNNQDHFIVTASSEDVVEGQYTATVAVRSIGTQKVTGTTLSFHINSAKNIASTDGE